MQKGFLLFFIHDSDNTLLDHPDFRFSRGDGLAFSPPPFCCLRFGLPGRQSVSFSTEAKSIPCKER